MLMPVVWHFSEALVLVVGSVVNLKFCKLLRDRTPNRASEIPRMRIHFFVSLFNAFARRPERGVVSTL